MTVPVGVVVPLACLTVAVSVIGELSVMLAEDAVKVVEVLTTAGLTVTAVAPEADALNVEVPA